MLQMLAVDWPTIIFSTLVGGGLISAAWIWFRHKRRRAKIEQELEEFKARVVRSGEVMDSLREKHRRLPAIDPDFKVPMEGATREEYAGIQHVLDQYRDHWLELMDLWDRVQKLVETESTGRNANFEQAHELLGQAGQLEKLAALESECRQRIQRLQDSHDDARSAATRVDVLSEELIGHLEQIEVRGFAPDPYQTEMDSVAELTDDGQQVLEADPLSALDRLGTARSRLSEMISQTREVMQCEDEARDLDQELEQLTDRVEQMRGEGFLFVEPDASPDAVRGEYQVIREELKSLLNRGALETARSALETARRHVTSLRVILDTSRDMRDNSRVALEERRAALRRLLDEADAARLEEKALEATYPAESWRGVVENLESAKAIVDTMTELLDQAEGAIADDVQHYVRAGRLIDEVREREPEVEETIRRVAQRRAELDEQRDECRERVKAMDAESSRIGRLLANSRADRDLCNHRYNMARQRIEDVVRSTQTDEVVDWPWVATKAEECREDFERVEALYQQDLMLFKQAQSEIQSAEQEIRRARSFYRSGVSADTSRASGLALDASRALSNQDYERAVKHANEAEQAARDSQVQAKNEMERRQREQNRHRWQERQRQMKSLVEFGAAAAARALQELARRR